MKKQKKKSTAIKDLFLDRPTSHGGWPDGHPGSYTDPKTPVNKQIADYLKAMGLVDDDNPRARLSENRVRKLIRECINEALSANMPKRYYRYRAGIDDETVKRLESLEDDGPESALQARELAVSLGSEEPQTINVEKVSGISDEFLDAYIYDAVNDSIKNELNATNFSRRTDISDIIEYFAEPTTIASMIEDIIDASVYLSLEQNPGNSKIRRFHVLKVGNDPEHYSRLTHESIMEEIRDTVDYIFTYDHAYFD